MLLLQNPSAIAALLQQMTGQQPAQPGGNPPFAMTAPTQGAMPAPDPARNMTPSLMGQAPGAPAPMGAPAPAGPNMAPAGPGPNMFDRITGRVRGTLGLDNDPREYEGVLSEQDIASTRPGLLEGLFGRTLGQGNADRTAKLDRLVEMQKTAKEMAQQRNIQSARQRIATQFAPPMNETGEQLNLRLRKMHAEFSRVGDTEMMGKLSEVIKSIQPDTTQPDKDEPQPVKTMNAKGERIIQGLDRKGNIIWERPDQPVIRDNTARDNAEFQREFQRESTLTKDFETQTKSLRDAADDIQQSLRNAYPSAKAGDGMAQVDMLYAFITALDRESTVREGEVALAREAAAMWDWAKANVEKVKNKAAIVTPAQIEQMKRLMEKRVSRYGVRIDGKAKYFEGRAKKYKLRDVEVMFPRLDLGQPDAGPAGPASKKVQF